MASRISQMRNGIQPYPQTQQGQLNQSIEQVKGLMQQVQAAQNPQATLAAALQNNPNTAFIANMLNGNGGNLEQLAKQMAKEKGYDINDIIRKLGGT